jgi:hypothetical protein
MLWPFSRSKKNAPDKLELQKEEPPANNHDNPEQQNKSRLQFAYRLSQEHILLGN